MNDALQSRLYNYKFDSAAGHLGGEPEPVRDLVEVLARQYGNTGWIMGDQAILINAALRSIGVTFDD